MSSLYAAGIYSVYLLDDHAVAREGVRGVISAEHGMRVVGESCVRPGVVEDVLASRADLVVVGDVLAECGAEAFVANLKRMCPGVGVVVLAGRPSFLSMIGMLRAGARGYLGKARGIGEIVRALRAVARGGRFVDEEFEGKLAVYVTSGVGEGRLRLSARQEQVLRMMVYGYRAREIASVLGLSEKTVLTHKERALVKLQIESKSELVEYALREGWFEQGEVKFLVGRGRRLSAANS